MQEMLKVNLVEILLLSIVNLKIITLNMEALYHMN